MKRKLLVRISHFPVLWGQLLIKKTQLLHWTETKDSESFWVKEKPVLLFGSFLKIYQLKAYLDIFEIVLFLLSLHSAGPANHVESFTVIFFLVLIIFCKV